jgi:hypothetical protein
MAKQIISGKLAGEMKEIFHSVGFRPVLGLSGAVAGLTRRLGKMGSVSGGAQVSRLHSTVPSGEGSLCP